MNKKVVRTKDLVVIVWASDVYFSHWSNSNIGLKGSVSHKHSVCYLTCDWFTCLLITIPSVLKDTPHQCEARLVEKWISSKWDDVWYIDARTSFLCAYLWRWLKLKDTHIWFSPTTIMILIGLNHLVCYRSSTMTCLSNNCTHIVRKFSHEKICLAS